MIEKLEQRRAQSGLTVALWATAIAGVSQTTYWRYQNGERISSKICRRMIAYFIRAEDAETVGSLVNYLSGNAYSDHHLIMLGTLAIASSVSTG